MLIKNAKVTGFDTLLDILIKDGKIAKIAQNIDEKDEELIEAKGSYALPGLIDLNVRLKNGVLNQKNLDTLSNDCARGGVTTALIISDFTPRLDNESFLELLNAKVGSLGVNVLLSAPLVNDETEKLNNIATLIQNGASAIWSKSHINSNLIRRGVQYANMKKTPLLVDCYDSDLDDNGVMNEGKVSFKLGLPGISKVSETSEVARLCEIAGYYKADIVFQTLSSERSINLVKEAKKNLKAYSEVSIHHLLKNDSSCDEFNTHAKIKPPLRDENEREAIVQELKNGDIDILTSAHSPRSILYKDTAFEDAAYGIHAISDYLQLGFTYLVSSGLVSLERFIQMSSKMPAQILGLERKGEIKEGFDADIVIFDPKSEETIKVADSIYANEKLKGRVTTTIAKGKIVYQKA
ncbi:MAG: amidohydrolase family protein [Campylobacteraceae bacterium]|jgi:dihydroorotase|nr:amidohydrolase family protein [Campylobacteraceae bacterium]